MTTMQTQVDTDIDVERLQNLLPPWRVILHNDDHNSMDHVVRSLRKCVPSLSEEEAEAVMLEAHETGKALVIQCPKEAAEHYRVGLETCGLTATIER
jgi:ATP-dependent Clp protease adaptor protein ClpS